MNRQKCIEAGSKAPDFTLMDHHKKPFTLSNFKGKRILLSFHPLAWTSVCAKQMKSLEANWKNFEELNTIAVGINVDPVPSKQAWAESLGIEHVSLLSDFWPHGKTAQLYGIFRENDGFSERANIIVDEDQTIAYAQVYEISQLPDIEEILTLLGRGDKMEVQKI